MRYSIEYANQYELWTKLMGEALGNNREKLTALKDSLPGRNLTKEQQATLVKRINRCLGKLHR